MSGWRAKLNAEEPVRQTEAYRAKKLLGYQRTGIAYLWRR